ncbi:cytochrome P450 [Streptomyces sp. NPDC051662]|uniref:cytochrome P450 n=1 Tax=Streptomyces sp. NPDC051662 TaxID=3154750 RepID=UPI00342B940F
MNGAAIFEQLVTSQGRKDPYPIYAEAQKSGTVLPLGAGMVMAVGYDAVSAVLRNPAAHAVNSRTVQDPEYVKHSANLLLSSSIIQSEGVVHDFMRTAAASAFTAVRLKKLRLLITSYTERLLDEMAEQGKGGAPVDFVASFAARLPIMVISHIMGIPKEDAKHLSRMVHDSLASWEIIPLKEHIHTADKAADQLLDYVQNLIVERRTQPSEDLTSRLVAAFDADGRFPEDVLRSNIALLLTAGSLTTIDMLGNMMPQLLSSPDIFEKLRNGQIQAAPVVEEAARFDSSVQITVRTLRTETRVPKYDPLPAGTQVLAVIGAANRDPARYSEPHRFDPFRKKRPLLTFGAGAHFCLGAQLARIEGAIALDAIVRRFPHMALAGEPVGSGRLVLRGHQFLPVAVA